MIASSIRSIIITARSRYFDYVELRIDDKDALAAMSQELNCLGIVLDVAGSGQHVPTIENKSKTIKERVRAHKNSLPYVMTRLLITMCVMFCVSRLNMQPRRVSVDRTSSLEQFTGCKIDATRDLRIQFGECVQATDSDTDNTMRSRTQGCIALLPTRNLCGSVKMLRLATGIVVTRDQFKILPMPDLVVMHITLLAASQGYTRQLPTSPWSSRSWWQKYVACRANTWHDDYRWT